MAIFSKFRPEYAVRTVCVGFMMDQVALSQVSISVFQSLVNYHLIKSSYIVCTIRWMDSECNGGWRFSGTRSLPIMKNCIPSNNNIFLKESQPGLHGYRVLPCSLSGTSWGWRNSWVSNAFYVDYELRLKKMFSAECFLCGVLAEAEERVECRTFPMWSRSRDWRNIWMPNFFYVYYELRLKKQLSVECSVCGVRSEGEERVECRMFSMWSTSWGWTKSWVPDVFYVDYELRLKK